jgi:hypothetical protein
VINERVPRWRILSSGIVESSGGPVRAGVIDEDGKVRPEPVRVVRLPVGDGAVPTANVRHRLTVETTCVERCAIVVIVPGREPFAVPLLEETARWGEEGATWVKESFRLTPPEGSDAWHRQARLLALEVLGTIYRVAALPLLGAVLVVLAVRAWRMGRRRRADPLVFVSTALLVGIAVRLVVLALVDATSFPAVNILYAAPAMGLYVALLATTLLGRSVEHDTSTATPAAAPQGRA